MQATQKTEKTRLGDILIDKGLISEAQLKEAISVQLDADMPLGQILVEKGWVSRRQINQALKVQSKLRNALVSSIISLSPLALVGCGSGGSAVEEAPVEAQQMQEVGSQSQVEQGGTGASDSASQDSASNDESGSESNVVVIDSQNSNGADEEQTSSSDSSSGSQTDGGLELTNEEIEALLLAEGAESQETNQTEEAATETPVGEVVEEVVEEVTEEVVDETVEEVTEELVNQEPAVPEAEQVEPALASVEFNWNYPTQRADGSEFEVYEVQGFRIYQVSDSGEADQVHEVDGLDTSFTVNDLATGDYQFAITVVDTEGLESDLSESISITI